MATNWQELVDRTRAQLASASERRMVHVNVGPTERAVSIGSGAVLVGWGFKRGDWGGAALALGGAVLLYRGVTGHCPVNEAIGRDTSVPPQHARGVDLTRAITIDRPRAEVYRTWRRLELLPRFMHHLAEVRELDGGRSRWRARLPSQALGLPVQWEAQIVHDDEERRIAWRSLPDADIHNSGAVRFSDTADGRGTQVHVHIVYRPPQGQLGAQAARLLNPALAHLIEEDLQRFKSMMESGELAAEVPTARQPTTGQPTPEQPGATGPGAQEGQGEPSIAAASAEQPGPEATAPGAAEQGPSEQGSDERDNGVATVQRPEAQA